MPTTVEKIIARGNAGVPYTEIATLASARGISLTTGQNAVPRERNEVVAELSRLLGRGLIVDWSS